MKAILLAAGFGTRLRPLTDNIPKCLVPIKGKPLLEIWLEMLSEASINAFTINTHYLHEKVENFISTCSYQKQTKLFFEKDLLGTAGTLVANLDFFEGKDGIFLHADNYCKANLSEFIQAHFNRPSHCIISMMTFRTDAPSSCGIVEIDNQNVVIAFHEKVASPPSNLANGAIYILSPEFLNIMRTELSDTSDFSTEVLSRFIGRIFTYETSEFFLDIGTPAAYAKANS